MEGIWDNKILIAIADIVFSIKFNVSSIIIGVELEWNKFDSKYDEEVFECDKV